MRAKTQSDQVPGTKVMRLIMCLVLGTLSLGTYAQEAFYIYRNDGDFNGFFYDEVIEMRQSKIGVDSIEYDRWVTQEVVLADTIYRIPLAAIDSIGFQQPEIIINSEVRHMDLLGMTPYVTSRDDQTLTFSNELPTSLLPQIGNVLFGMEGIFEAENFGGRVMSVHNEGSSIIVETDKLTKMSDIFVQFITMEEVGFAEDEPNQLYYRMAGMNKIREWQGSFSVSMFNVNTNLHIPINAGGTVGGSIDASFSFKNRMSVLYQINEDVYFIKCRSRQDFGIQTGLTINVDGGDEETYPLIPEPFATLKWPVYPPFPLFECTPVPKLGYRWGGSLATQITLPGVSGSMTETIVFDSDLPGLMRFEFTPDFNLPETEGFLDALVNPDIEVKLEGYYQLGLKEELALKTNSVFSSIISASTGVDFWLGPKLSASLNLDAKAFWTSDDGPYLFRNSHIGLSTLSLDMEAYSKIDDIFLDEPIKKTWIDESKDIFPALDLYAFPNFTKFEAAFNDSTQAIEASWEAEPRLILWPCSPGIVVYYLDYGETKIVASSYDNPTVRDQFMGEKFNEDFDNLKARSYRVAPALLVGGTEFPVRSMAKDILVPFTIKMSPDSLHFDASGTPEQTINFTTNCPPDMIQFVSLWDLHLFDEYTIDTLDKTKGNYQLRVKAAPNRYLFGQSCNYSKKDYNCPYLNLSNQPYPIGFSQDDNNLSNVNLTVSGEFKFIANGGVFTAFAHFDGMVSATRTGDSIITISGTSTSGYETATIQITLVRQPGTGGLHSQLFKASGTITTSGIDERTTITFADMDGVSYKTDGASVNAHSGTITSGVTHVRWDGQGPEQTYHMSTDQNAEVYIDLYPKAPGEQ